MGAGENGDAASASGAGAAAAEALGRERLVETGDDGLVVERFWQQATRLDGLPPGLAAGLIGRRPEVVAARWRVEAAASRIKVARAQFYPNVDLLGLIGVESLGVDNLLKSGADIGSVGLAVDLPIFDGGRRSGALRGARPTTTSRSPPITRSWGKPCGTSPTSSSPAAS